MYACDGCDNGGGRKTSAIQKLPEKEVWTHFILGGLNYVLTFILII